MARLDLNPVCTKQVFFNSIYPVYRKRELKKIRNSKASSPCVPDREWVRLLVPYNFNVS